MSLNAGPAPVWWLGDRVKFESNRSQTQVCNATYLVVVKLLGHYLNVFLFI